MRAVGYRKPLPAEDPAALEDIELPKPEAQGRDLLVEIRAVSVNPVDTKVRRRAGAADGGWKVLGFDAAGVVVAAGPEAALFRPGDAVFYAGAIDRPGTNAEFHLVDERIVGRKPESLDWAQAAALPLTAITAWEMLFDRLEIRPAGAGRGAGGADRRRRRRRRVDGGAAGAAADRAHGDRHRLAAGVAGVGADARGASGDRPRPAAGGAGGGAGARRAGAGVLDHAYRRASRRDREAGGAAGALRLHRRPERGRSWRRSRPRACRSGSNRCSPGRCSTPRTWPSSTRSSARWRGWSMPARSGRRSASG